MFLFSCSKVGLGLLTTQWLGGSGSILPSLNLGQNSVRNNEYLLLGMLQKGAFSRVTAASVRPSTSLLMDIVSSVRFIHI